VASFPSGFSKSGVPTALQIVGRTFDDISVFRAAAGHPISSCRLPVSGPGAGQLRGVDFTECIYGGVGVGVLGPWC